MGIFGCCSGPGRTGKPTSPGKTGKRKKKKKSSHSFLEVFAAAFSGTVPGVTTMPSCKKAPDLSFKVPENHYARNADPHKNRRKNQIYLPKARAVRKSSGDSLKPTTARSWSLSVPSSFRSVSGGKLDVVEEEDENVTPLEDEDGFVDVNTPEISDSGEAKNEGEALPDLPLKPEVCLGKPGLRVGKSPKPIGLKKPDIDGLSSLRKKPDIGLSSLRNKRDVEGLGALGLKTRPVVGSRSSPFPARQIS